jgi:WD40-like Beta Propeller Repeat
MLDRHRTRLSLLMLFLMIVSWACNYTRITDATPTPLTVTERPAVSQAVEPPASDEPSTTPESEPATPEAEPATPEAGELRVVYTKDQNLWLWQDGKTRQVTTTGDAYNPTLSHDGRTIAFLRPAGDFHTELWAIDLAGTNERRLVSITDLDAIGGGVRDPSAVAINPYHFSWVPGTRSLAFNTQQVFNGPGLSLLDDLNLVDADSGKITNLFLAGWGGEFVYSPDGSQIAISRPDTLILTKADGSNYQPVLHYEPVLTYSEYRYYAMPLWSVDGEFLRLALPPVESLAQPAQPTVLWKIPTDGSAPLQEGSVLAVPFFDQPVRYSPDLERLAFLRETGQPSENRREFLLTTYDGKGEWVYAAGPLMHFESWSTDSRSFIYTIGEDQAAWLGSLDGPPQPMDGDSTGVSSVQWVSPNQFIYVVQRGETFDLNLRGQKSGALLMDTTIGVPPVYDFIR